MSQEEGTREGAADPRKRKDRDNGEEESLMRRATAAGLRRARERSGLSREQVRRALGHGYKTVVLDWENGHHLPDLKSAVRLAKLYECSLEKLLGPFIGFWSASIERPPPATDGGYRRPPAHRRRKWEQP